MSWSINLIGKPPAIIDELDKFGETLIGRSKLEFQSAKQHLIGLVRENFARDGIGYSPTVLKLEAQGSCSEQGGVQIQRSCRVVLEHL